MTSAVVAALALHVAAAAWVLWFFRDGPEGYEDAKGFHYGVPPADATDDQTPP